MNRDLELNTLIERYRKIDFSQSSQSKDIIFKKLQNKLDTTQATGKIIKRYVYVLVAIMVLLLSFSIAVYGQDIVGFVKDIFLGSHARFSSHIERDSVDYSIPEELSGQVYDEEGNVLEQYSQDFGDYIKVYDESSQQVFSYEDSDGVSLLTEDELREKTEERRSSMTTAFNTVEEAEAYFKYDYMTPQYLPAGYEFVRAEIYNTDEGVPQQETKYLDIYYGNGKTEINMSVVFMDSETAFELGGAGELEEIDINGYKAVKVGKRMLSVEIDGMVYTFFRDNHTDDIVQMAKSLKGKI